MQKVKWIFFGYVAFVLLTIVAIAVAFDAAPPRDPETYYATYGGAIKTLDPAEVGDSLGSQILSYSFEGLYNYKYKVVPYELFPELASAMPTMTDGGLTMTIPVRHGVRYYDPEKALWPDGVGPEVTAADFVYAFKRICNFTTSGGNYSFMFQDRVAGVNDWYTYTQNLPQGQAPDYDRPVAGFTVDPADPYKLVLRFTGPYPQMIYNLVNCPCAPVCRALVDHWGDQFRKHPVGTGAYAMTENLREQRITFVANPIYRGRPDVDGGATVSDADRYPKIKRVQLDYFSNNADMAVWLLFQQGLFDVGGIPKDAYSQAIAGAGDLTPAMSRRGIVLRKYSDPSTSYIGFNMADPVLGKNRPLRQALSMAFDRQSYIDKFANGRGMAAIGPIPPGFPTFDPHRVNPYTQFNLAAARKLMVEAERINGGPIPPLKILFRDSDTTARQMAAFYVDQFAAVGVTLEPEYKDFARWQQMVDDRQVQIFDGGWSSDYPDEQDFLQLFYGPNAPAGGLNSVVYHNDAFDKLYASAIVMQDTPQRRAIYLQLQQMVEADCPWLIVDYPVTFDLSYDWVGNRFPMDYGHGFTQFVTLDQALRSKRLGAHH